MCVVRVRGGCPMDERLEVRVSQKTLQDLCRRKRWDFNLGISSGMRRHTGNRISQS